jgi:pSer/pThr/pTyr-binding forkhead associated (FHA) protein
MAKLILSMDGLVLKEIALATARMSIGRKASNDIQIDNLAISGEHAAVVTILNDSFLEDLNSTNGTLVNGHPAKKHFLKNGDVIELGKYKLKYVAEPVAPVDSADFEKSMAAWPGALNQAAGVAPAAATAVVKDAVGPASPDAAPSPAGAALAAGAIRVLSGANAGRQLELTKALTTLGKPGVQVAVIARRPHGYFITHVEGLRYPQVNGQAIEAQARALADHDVIEIAGIKMEFFLKNP